MEELDCVVLDSDLIIALLRGRRDAKVYVEGLEARGAELATTVINLFEVFYGAYRRGRGVEAVRMLAEAVRVIGVDARVAEAAAEEAARLAAEGRGLEFRDVLIGVAARMHGCSIATCNTRHLGRIRGLHVERWC